MDHLRETVIFWPKTISKVAIIKTRSAGIAFFLPSFPLFALFYSPFLILELIGLKKPAF